MNNYISKNVTHTKKDIKKILLISFIMYAVCIFPCKNIFVSLTIVLIASAILLFTYFFIISKTFLNENKILKWSGTIGLFNSFVFTLLTAYQKGKTFIEMLVTFFIMIGIIFFIIILLEIASRKSSIWKKNKKISKVSNAVICFFVFLGMITSRLFIKNEFEMKFEFIFGMFSIIFAFFYGAFIKCKNNNTEEQSEQS